MTHPIVHGPHIARYLEYMDANKDEETKARNSRILKQDPQWLVETESKALVTTIDISNK